MINRTAPKPGIAASRITTASRVYLIVALFVALIFGLVWLFQFQMEASVAMRVYAGGEGLWAKAQKDAVLSLEHYIVSYDEADYQAYRRLIQVPLGDQTARIELQKPDPDLDIVRKGYLQGRTHPVDVEYAIPFFSRFQHTAQMARVIEHWSEADRLIAELGKEAEVLHDEIASGRARPRTISVMHDRLEVINRQLTAEEDLFASSLAEASRWANDASRNLTYAIALLFAMLGITLSWPIIARIRRTEKALVESEGRYRGIFEGVGDVIYTIEADGKLSSLSPAFERLTGWLPDEWVGQPFAGLVHPDDLPQALEIFQKTMLGESTRNFDARINKKSGACFDAEHSIVPIFRSGKTTVLLGIARDITERRQAEHALHESEASLRTLVEHSPVAMIVDVGVDADEKIVMMNQKFTGLFGYTMEDVPDVRHWWPLAYPDEKYREEVKAEWTGKVGLAIQSHSDIEPMETTVTCKDGASRYVRFSLSSTGSRNIITFEDLTERKTAEEKIRKQQQLTTQIIETIPMRVFWKDRDSRFLGCNTSFAKDAGLIHPDELIGKTDFEMVWRDQAELYRADDRRVMDSNTPRLFYDEPQTTPEGAHIWLRTSKVPLRSAEDERIGVLGIYEDITDYKLMELSLLESEERFRKAFQYSSIGMALVGLDGRWLKVNHAFRQIVGYSEQELLSKTFQDITHPDDLQSDLDFVAKLLTGEIDHYQMEKRYFHKDGHVVWIRLSVSLIRDEQDKPIHFVAQIDDITGEKLAAEAMQKANIELTLFRKLLDKSSDAIEVIDPVTARFLDVNEKTCRDLGYSREELLAMSVFDIDPSFSQGSREMMDEQMQKSGTARFEGIHRRKDGSTFAVETSIGYVMLDKPYLLSVVRDITERKLAEASLRESSKRLNEAQRIGKMGFLDWDLTTNEIELSDETLQMYGLDPARKKIGVEEIINLLHPDDAAFAVKSLYDAIEGRGKHDIEQRIVRPDGRVIYVHTSAEVFKDENDKPIRVLGTALDVTEIKLAQVALRQLNNELEINVHERTKQLIAAQEELVRSEKLAVLGQVAGSVGHELRNPLGVMSNAVYFLQTVLSDADDSVKEYLSIIKDEIAGSERIVSDLLDSVRTQPPHPAMVGVTELIGQTMGKLTIPPAVSVKLDIPETLPAIRVDAMQIHQVLRNLISNGVEAMPEGGTLQISAVADKAEKNITVSVRDSGIGMTPEQLGHLFQPLFTTKARGIGLGLVVVKNLTEANGGKVEVQSEPGRGSTFAVTLPCG